MSKERKGSRENVPRALVRVSKNYQPLAQSTIISPSVTVGDILDAHATLSRMGVAASAGGELVGPWYVYKEGAEGAQAQITTEQVNVLVEAGVLVREVTLRELITVGQEFSGPSLSAGGTLVGPWYVYKEGSNRLETLGEITVIDLG